MKQKRTVFLILIGLVAALLAALLWCYRAEIVYFVSQNDVQPQLHEYTQDLSYVTQIEAYQGNVLLSDPQQADLRYDVKKVYRMKRTSRQPAYTRVVDFPNGFYVDLPGDVSFDFSLGEGGIKGVGENYQVLLTRESSPYDDVITYLDEYINRYVGSRQFQEANNITLHEDGLRTIGNHKVRLLSVTRNPHDGSEVTHNTYTYAYVLDDDLGRMYHRIMIKSTAYDKAMVEQIVASLCRFTPIGRNMITVDTKPVLPKWNEETAAFYDSLCNREDVLWGVYNYKLITVDGMAPTMEELQQKLDYRFNLCMGYTYLMEEPPVKGLWEAYNDGKITELTLQVCTIDHAALDSAKNPNFEVIDGLWDEQIRKYAKAFKEFSHPILFRVNNEMNTDWCTYSGVVTMQDPDIYRMVHKRIFDIFQEEGVENVIWIFNPQYGNYPPASFNNYMNYYPGNDQIQLLGVTKYNTGNYFYDLFLEQWSDFKPAFDELNDLYTRTFPDVPWIVTEFASSSYGGDKAAWMKEMFTHMSDYKNIKAAVWFNWGDRDFREGKEDIIARPYYLDETPETLDVFRRGVKGEFSKPKAE